MLPEVQQTLSHAHQQQHWPEALTKVPCLDDFEDELQDQDAWDQAVEAGSQPAAPRPVVLVNAAFGLEHLTRTPLLTPGENQRLSSTDTATSKEKVGAPEALEKVKQLFDFYQPVLLSQSWCHEFVSLNQLYRVAGLIPVPAHAVVHTGKEVAMEAEMAKVNAAMVKQLHLRNRLAEHFGTPHPTERCLQVKHMGCSWTPLQQKRLHQ